MGLRASPGGGDDRAGWISQTAFQDYVQCFRMNSEAHLLRVARHPPNLSTSDFWAPSRQLDRKKPCGRRAPAAIAYTQTTCSTGVMPTPQSLAAKTMAKPCFLIWQAFTPTQPHKPGNKI